MPKSERERPRPGDLLVLVTPPVSIETTVIAPSGWTIHERHGDPSPVVMTRTATRTDGPPPETVDTPGRPLGAWWANLTRHATREF